ncbi:M48 family metalloprotease [Phytoactinopolyspora alkaliphila]|uniref:M48 family metalloprotease n=1 Tax=Phytoactinopolyspora alkaliphila TaxID=1783498 RepID=UPI001C206D2D
MQSGGAHRSLVRVAVVLVSVFLVLALASRFGFGVFVATLACVAGFGTVAYLRSDSAALQDMRAYPVGEAQQPTLCRIVREMTTRARVPMPRVYVSPTRAATAFAVGRAPHRASVCVTEGALGVLDERELRAVVGHELAHIRRGDTLPASMAGVVARGVASVPLIGTGVICLTRLALDTAREFDADHAAARMTGEPLALASALRKLDAATRELALPAEPGVVAASHLMIISPLSSVGRWKRFRSHPSLADRVARLEQLAGYRR